MRAIIGLGNPGKEYEMTRHNMGFLVVKRLAHEKGLHFRWEERFEGHRAKMSDQDKVVDLFMPATYMNESGKAARKLLTYFQIVPSKVIVVVDDMDLPFGQMRLKAFGGSGGHNGLKSLERELGTSHFMRLRIGIGRPKELHIEHVLGKFSREEQELLESVVEKAVNCLKRLFTEEFSKVACDVNRKELNDKEEKKV